MNSPAEFDLLKCLGLGKDLIYLSTPLTTGRRFYEDWYAPQGQKPDPEKFKKLIFDENKRASQHLSEVLRGELRRPVLNPAELKVDGWATTEYMRLWLDFLREVKPTVVMACGWEYSNGCVLEIQLAYELGLNVFAYDEEVDINLVSLNPEHAHGMLSKAIAQIQEWGMEAPTLEWARDNLT